MPLVVAPIPSDLMDALLQDSVGEVSDVPTRGIEDRDHEDADFHGALRLRHCREHDDAVFSECAGQRGRESQSRKVVASCDHIIALLLCELEHEARREAVRITPDLLLETAGRDAVHCRQVEEIVRQGIFEPLGISDYLWEANSDGVTRGGHSLFLRLRDMAKASQLMLDGGAWQGRQLVSEDWMALSTAAQKTESLPGEEPAPVYYGFYWWSLPARNAFTAWGHGGQFIFVLPDYDTVVVMTSMPSTNDDHVGTRLPEFADIVEQVVAAGEE